MQRVGCPSGADCGMLVRLDRGIARHLWRGLRSNLFPLGRTKDFAMWNWKNRGGSVRERVDDRVDDVRAYFGGPWLVRVVGGLLGAYLVVTALVGWYWSREPDLFPVQQQQQVADGLRAGGADAHFIGLESPQGHDAFLVDFERFGPAVRGFLDAL